MKKTILTLDIIFSAVQGEAKAQRIILQHYDKYINSLVTTVSEDENGNKYYQLDEDLKIQLQYKYLEGIKKWKVIEK
ncbi:helix-turn-helix domain-containing protein [Hespellia stercorisuis]|uniref:Helix-turn-helix domain-containing protein n=1 Tax=Hespellia stercorisuis DSM 15480 TaxID=1121950 RepID=A0A1M6SEI3_9FIRM|nr:helix-turn-helix domain-containing protein [Hespellia stercorisuis]SHK43194.1 Helix-turn-helix domain-containing protein [Hespellia stercorisuis DSM 15480]